MFQKTLAKQMQPFLLFLTLSMVVVSFISCTGFDKVSASFAQKKAKESQPQVQDAKVLKDENGTVTAALSASNRGSSQRVSASSKSAIAGSSVVFPPGSLAIETDVEVTIGPAPTLVVEGATEIATAGPAVAIAANGGLELGVDFEMQIPLPAGQASLLGDSSQSFAVLFEYVVPSTKSKVTGRLQAGEFETDIAFAKFKFRYFGTFQVVKLVDPGTNVEKQAASGSNQNVATNNQNSGNTNSTGSSTGNGFVADTTSPTAGAWQSVSGVSETGFTLNWSAAVDDKTTSANLEYQICTSNRGSDIATAAQCASATGANVALGWTKGITNATRSGLNPGTTYFYNLVVRDEAQNLVVYGTQSAQTASNSAPTPGSYQLTTSKLPTSLVLNWTQATDAASAQASLSYFVCYSLNSSSIASTSDCQSATGIALNWSASAVGSTSVTGLLPGHTYHFKVLVKDPQGAIGSYGITTEAMPILNPSVIARYPAAANWMDYANVADGSACSTHSIPEGCVHGGELKKAQLVGITSCSGLSAEDNLGAFEWECIVDGIDVTFHSKGLKYGKKLSDLLTTSPSFSWRAMSLTIRNSGNVVIAASTQGSWWTNPVVPLASNTSPSVSGTIYLTASAVSRSTTLLISASKIGIVTTGSGKITASSGLPSCNGSGSCVINVYSPSFASPIADVWIEATIEDSATTVYGIYAKNSVRLRIDNTRMRAFTNGIKLAHSKTARVTDTAVMVVDQNCMLLDNAGISDAADTNSYHYVRNFQASDCGYHGLYLNSVNYNQFVRLRFNNNNASQTTHFGALELANASNNTFVDVVATNNHQNGITIGNSSSNNTFMNLTLANNEGSGFAITPVANMLQSLMSVVAVNNGSNGISANGAGLSIHGLAAGSNGSTQQIDANSMSSSGPTKFGLNSTCNDGTADAPCMTLFSGSSEVDLSNIFPASSVQTNYSTLSTQYGFMIDSANPFELYGNYVSPHNIWTYTANRGDCVNGATCMRWNWSANPGEQIYRVFPDFTQTAGFDCPAELDSVSNSKSRVAKNGDSPKYYLTNAQEVNTDLVGNNNGLCESNEMCLYARNLGAHQENTNFTKSCITPAVGNVVNAKIYAP